MKKRLLQSPLQIRSAKDWLENHYVHLITGILSELTGEDRLIQFIVPKDMQENDFMLPKPIEKTVEIESNPNSKCWHA